MTEPRWITIVHALPWAGVVIRFVAWLRRLRAKPDPLAGLNRRQRRAIRFTKPGELRMRIERTALRIAARKKHKRKSDGGAKYRRAYVAGIHDGRDMTLIALKRRVEQGQKAAA